MTIRIVLITGLLLASCIAPASGASFDCAKASTPFEKAICGSDDLSLADERLSRTYQTAIGGLSEAALETLRTDQREWLSYAQRVCTLDAKPMESGTYDERGVSCLIDVFGSRSQVLEASRMIDGRRFYPISEEVALPDPDAVGDSNPNWPVAKHELALLQLDETAAYAKDFNAFVKSQATALSDLAGALDGNDSDQLDAMSDTFVNVTLQEQARDKRISLDVTTYWFGHGAAHGNGTISFLHYLVDEGRGLEAGDLFTGKRWESALVKLVADALRAEHGDNLFLENDEDIVAIVTDPTRWDLSDDYFFSVQFNPYEVAAYAYGAPTARVSWEALAPYLSENADSIRYGF